MKITIAQINPIVADIEGNLNLIHEAVAEAEKSSPDLIIFPELALPGAHPQDILYDRTFIEALQAATADLANQLKDAPPIILGSVVPTNPSDPLTTTLYNAAIFIKDGESTHIASKQVLPIGDIAYEPRWFVKGLPTNLIELAGEKIGVLFANDLSDPSIAISLQNQGASLLIILAAQAYHQGIFGERLQQLKSVRQNICLANLAGANDALIYDGRSVVLNSGGELLAQAKTFSSDLLTVDLSAVTPIKPIKHPLEENLFNALVMGVSDFMRKNNLPHIHVGLSGGIDSALTVAIATAALGKENVTGIALPSRFSDPRSQESAAQLASNLGIEFKTVSIEKIHAVGESLIPDVFTGTAAENWQARARMMILMTHVNAKGGILMGTGNKTEFSFGYATLYGDLAGAMAPIGDLTKPQVYALSEWVNRDKEIIPEFMITRKPSAELRPDQFDPFDYPVEAPKIEHMIQTHRSPAVLKTTEHKRQQAGIVLRVSRKAFGSGRMVPITRK